MLWCLLAAAVSAEPVSSPSNGNATLAAPPSGRVILCEKHQGAWRVVDTPNFRIWCQQSPDESRALAVQCEAQRTAQRATWLTDAPPGDWLPRCEVVVHPTVTEYNRALGTVTDRSAGCSTLTVDGGRVVRRRIDVRADAVHWRTATLPHELTHVVIADALDKRTLAPWADEGLAALAESESQQSRRVEQLDRVWRSGRVYGLSDLIALRQPPPPALRDAFYGQSLLLVRFLVARKSPREFLRFLELAGREGDRAALRQVYGIADLGHMEQQWLAYIGQACGTPTAQRDTGGGVPLVAANRPVSAK